MPRFSRSATSSALCASLLLGTATLLGACKTNEAGITSTYRTQTAVLAADVQDTTEAAREVLESMSLRDVTSAATDVDGRATALKADGTEINVYAARETASTTEVSVVIGTVGEPELGTEILAEIRDRLAN